MVVKLNSSSYYSEEDDDGILVMPSWNHAKEWKKGKYEVVETALKSQVSVVFCDEQTNNRIDWDADGKIILNVARMVIRKNLETGVIDNFIMIVMGSYDYIMDDDNQISNNNYLYREANFDGEVMFYKPDGGLINGWVYDCGNIVKHIQPVEDSNNETGFELRSGTNCYYETYYSTSYVCPDNQQSGYDPEFGVWVSQDECNWETEYIIVEVCDSDDDDGEVDDGGGSSGGDSVDSDESNQAATEEAKKIR